MLQVMLLSAVAALIAAASFAQEARKVRIGDFLGDNYQVFNDIYVTQAGNYLACGGAPGQTGHNMWIVLADRGGDKIWNHTFPHDNDDLPGEALSIIETDDGDFVAGGQREMNDRWDFTVISCDAEGNQNWWNTYGGNQAGICMAVIETKGGSLLACGYVGKRNSPRAYVVMLEPDGEIIWQRVYDDGVCFNAVREIDGGFILVDYGPNEGVTRINAEGGVVWQRQVNGYLLGLVSCPFTNGFAACGTLNRTVLLVNFDGEGNITRTRAYNRIEGAFDGSANSLVQLPDGGFLMTGERPLILSRHQTIRRTEIRVDSNGSLLWQRGFSGVSVFGYLSVVLDIDSTAVIAGSENFRQGPPEKWRGVIDKVFPERSAPRIVGYEPDSLEFEVLRLDTVQFNVEAIDWQEDDIQYQWLLDDTVRLGRVESQEVIFNDLGEHIVSCVVSDGQDANRIDWRINVIELYISEYKPDSLNLIIPRHGAGNFHIDVIAAEPELVEVTWTITDSVVATEADATIQFPLPGRYELTATATANDFSDQVRWDVEVQSVIREWWPLESELSLPKDTVLVFVLVASNPESDSLSYRWVLGDNEVGTEDEMILSFPDTGQFRLAGLLSDGSETDSMEWQIEVVAPDFIREDDETGRPVQFGLISLYPNPFNRTVTVDYNLDRAATVELSVFNPAGERIYQIYSGFSSAGRHRVIWNAVGVPSGLYFIKLESDNRFMQRSAVLLK